MKSAILANELEAQLTEETDQPKNPMMAMTSAVS